jgi:hypothetical protein
VSVTRHSNQFRTPTMALNTRTIRSLVKAQRPGMWAARNGLNLVISVSGSPTWALRYSTQDGKRRLMKLADYEPIDEAALAGLEADAGNTAKRSRRATIPWPNARPLIARRKSKLPARSALRSRKRR